MDDRYERSQAYRRVAGNRVGTNDQSWNPAGTGMARKPSNDFPINDKLGADINTSDLVDTHTRRRNQRAKIYERVYRKCCQRIRHSNDILYRKDCVFKVPEVQLWGGIPRYQVNAVVSYIMIRLKQKGFDVRFLPPDSIMINWERAVSGDKMLKDNNIVRYELDEKATAAYPLEHTATTGERLIHRGCKGECCTGPDAPRPKRLNPKDQLELERRKQQIEIDRLIKSRR